jgi:RNA 3'-phosphate cyclase
VQCGDLWDFAIEIQRSDRAERQRCTRTMIEIDGSLGEGGGQILRTSLTLSVLTRQPVHLTQIRSGRKKPGLQPQHVRAVDAAAGISKAEVEGAHLHASELTFIPQQIRSGRYRFEIGTAGSTTLVLQTVLIPLSMTSSASTVIISGGTHVPWSPAFHYLQLYWLPFLKEMGFDASLQLDTAGYYPTGGGRISATIRPIQQAPAPLHLDERGRLLRISGVSAVSNLPLSIADRQKRQALRRLQAHCSELRIKTAELPSPGKGTMLLLTAEFEPGRGVYTALDALGKSSEQVADEAVDDLLAFLESEAAVDEHMADQLLLPLSLAEGSSSFTTPRITPHLRTNAAVLQAFLPVKIMLQQPDHGPARVEINP